MLTKFLEAFGKCLPEIRPHFSSTVPFPGSDVGPSVCGIILFSTVLLSTPCHEQMPVAYNSATVFSPIYIFLEIIGDTVDVSRDFLKPTCRPFKFWKARQRSEGPGGLGRGQTVWLVTVFLFWFFP